MVKILATWAALVAAAICAQVTKAAILYADLGATGAAGALVVAGFGAVVRRARPVFSGNAGACAS